MFIKDTTTIFTPTLIDYFRNAVTLRAIAQESIVDPSWGFSSPLMAITLPKFFGSWGVVESGVRERD